jgi:Concanavalin A-like lectin/glucanases superfamily
MAMNLARAATMIGAAVLVVTGGGCVTPQTLMPGDGGDATGGATGGGGAIGQGGTTGGGSTGLGGATVGIGGRTGGLGGAIIIGPGVTLTDDFEAGAARWIADPDPGLDPSGTPCGNWAVIPDTALATNHVYQQPTNCSNPSWAANGSTEWIDMKLQARVRFDTGSTTSTKITLAVRFTNDRNQYYIEFSTDGKLKIRAKVEAGGGSSDINDVSSTRVPVPIGQWVTVTLAISGTTASVYLGDNPAAPPVITGPVAGLAKGGIAIGVQQGAASFDDIRVTPP